MSDEPNLSQQAANATRNWTNDRLQNWAADNSGAYNYANSGGGAGGGYSGGGVQLGATTIAAILAGVLGLLLGGLVVGAIFAAVVAIAALLLKYVFKGLGAVVAAVFGVFRGFPVWIIAGGALGCAAGAALAAWVDGPLMAGVVRLGPAGAIAGAIAWGVATLFKRKR
ncbi:MAG: hypothetical protein ABUS48_00410 [Pseudomonadota bacterium]